MFVSTRFTILDLGDATEEATEKVLLALDLNRSVPRVTAGGDADDEPLRGGASRALRHLARFFGDDPASGAVAQEQAAAKATTRPRDRAIDAYAEQRNNFSKRKQSHLSPYLHFGHISVVAIALHARAFLAANPEQQRDVDVFLDELVVRREFAVHFVKQHPGDYDSPTCLPVWAREGLRKHEGDAREQVYSATELEQGRTKDAAWNAAQQTAGEAAWMGRGLTASTGLSTAPSTARGSSSRTWSTSFGRDRTRRMKRTPPTCRRWACS